MEFLNVDELRTKLVFCLQSRCDTICSCHDRLYLFQEKKVSKATEQRNLHQSERRKVKRAGGSLLTKPKSKHWMGKKIR